MKFFKTSNLSLLDCNINSTIFINELLLEYLDNSKYIFYNEEYNVLRNNIVNNIYNKNKITNSFFNKNEVYILRIKDNKILKLPPIFNNNSLFNYSYFINIIKKSKKKFFFFI